MWLATQHGFYSIVRKADARFHVRARVHDDLLNLLRLVGLQVPIEESPLTDYRYRIIVDAEQLARIMAAIALDLDYPNFKQRIAQRSDQRAKLQAFHEIWELMAQLQETTPR
jgi:hypothetical protein